MVNTKIAKNLSKLISDRGITITELAREVNLPQPTVHRIATGSIANPHQSSLKPIAEYFSISVDQLRGLETIPEIDQIYKVRLIDWDEVTSIDDALSSNREQLITSLCVSKLAFALKVKDSSMEPVFPKGVNLIVDPNKEPRDRSYVIVKLSKQKEPIFRQLIIDTNIYLIKSLSPDLEQFSLVRLEDKDKIIGVVVQTQYNYV